MGVKARGPASQKQHVPFAESYVQAWRFNQRANLRTSAHANNPAHLAG